MSRWFREALDCAPMIPRVSRTATRPIAVVFPDLLTRICMNKICTKYICIYRPFIQLKLILLRVILDLILNNYLATKAVASPPPQKTSANKCDCIYHFPMDLLPNEIPYSTKSI